MTDPVRLCECGHTQSEHCDPEHFIKAWCLVKDCTCSDYEWDRDEGGVAVTRRIVKMVPP